MIQDTSLLNTFLLMGKGKKTKKVKKISSNKTTQQQKGSIQNRIGSNGQSSIQIEIFQDDTSEIITDQWNYFKNTFENNNIVLIFHLKNHYALIYATREWSICNQTTGELEIYREILTAKRGQRPTTWINFDEVRSIVLSWEGYKIIGISRKSSNVDVIEELQNLKFNLRQYQENMNETF